MPQTGTKCDEFIVNWWDLPGSSQQSDTGKDSVLLCSPRTLDKFSIQSLGTPFDTSLVPHCCAFALHVVCSSTDPDDLQLLRPFSIFDMEKQEQHH